MRRVDYPGLEGRAHFFSLVARAMRQILIDHARSQLAEQRAANQGNEARNAALDAEVRDLKSGYDAVEERSRYELGLIKPGEIFVQVPAKEK